MSKREVLWFGKSQTTKLSLPWLWGETRSDCKMNIVDAGERFIVPAKYEVREITKPRKPKRGGRGKK